MSSRTSRLALTVGATALAAYPAAVFATTYIVHPGDTLRDIAVRHGTTVDLLANANSLASSDLSVGQMLTIPDASLALPPYVIGHDDNDHFTALVDENFVSVAQRYGIDPTALARTNGIGVNAPLPAGSQLIVPGRLSRVNALLTTVAAEAGCRPELVRAVAWIESGWDQSFISPTGAVGLMQLEPSAGEWVAAHLVSAPLDLRRADDNVLAGSVLLRHLIQRCGGDEGAALASYYQGEASVAAHGPYEDTRNYVRDVQTLVTADATQSPLFRTTATL